ncbi:MAG TPA: AAA family ATPase [Phnomibacter sp.]|nr:AAA family ATPase [Phnomibacter sp.]
MKISKIKVVNLFETYTHEIHFNTEIGITLILGQNGLGKTIVLKIIEFILEGSFHLLSEIEFEYIDLYFEKNVSWKIERSINKEKGIELNIAFIDNLEVAHTISLADLEKNKDRLRNILRKYLPSSIRRMDEDEWYDRRTEEKLTTLELYSKYKSQLPKGLFGDFTIYPEWLSSVIDAQEISFIETQRLLTFYNITDEYSVRKSSGYKNTVEEYSELLSKEINLQLAHSSELATKLDRTYPNRLIARLTRTSNISQSQLNTNLNELEQKRSRLQKVGLLDLEMEPDLKFIKEQDERIREVLLVYIEDSRKKLEVYDTLADKIELFLKIINERFLEKKISISKEEGFHFESLRTGKTIPVTKLSSGEQHILVLYYKLLFILKKGTLLLMDEPEISLHITWQKKIIPDLLSILKLNPMDIIIATHSPAVIGKNWNLTVELNAQ